MGRGCDSTGANLTEEETQMADEETNPRLTVGDLDAKFPQVRI